MNDLEVLDRFVEDTCKTGMVHPLLFRDLEDRGISYLVNHLPNNVLEAKAVVRARLAREGRTFGDEEIDKIANDVKRLEMLRIKLAGMNMADAHKVKPILDEMQELTNYLLDYYK